MWSSWTPHTRLSGCCHVWHSVFARMTTWRHRTMARGSETGLSYAIFLLRPACSLQHSEDIERLHCLPSVRLVIKMSVSKIYLSRMTFAQPLHWREQLCIPHLNFCYTQVRSVRCTTWSFQNHCGHQVFDNVLRARVHKVHSLLCIKRSYEVAQSPHQRHQWEVLPHNDHRLCQHLAQLHVFR